GQSLTVDGDRLYIVVNGSGTVEVIERTASALQYVGRIDLAGAGPREMAVHDSTGYVTCWYLNAVLTINLTTLAVTDTILLPGMPEDILVFDEVLYVAVPLQTGWSTYDQVITVDPVTVGPTATYSVGNGPQQLAVFNGEIYVSRQWYDENYTSYRGIARIDPGQGQVEKADWGTGGGVDIFLANGTLYLATGSGVQALKPDLSLDEASAIGSEVAHQYAAGSDGERIFITASDFVNPGQIHVFTTGDQLLAQFTVGTNPGAFAFFRE
ncbi:MAG: YncE family protein, partial [Candidatus Neomarinimicrobiota bacterium]